MQVTATGLDLLYPSSMVSYRDIHRKNDYLAYMHYIYSILLLYTGYKDCMLGNGYVMYLRLGEHIQTPGAHLTIRGHSDQVVGVLGADHIYAIHWVLCSFKIRRKTKLI